MTHLNLVTALVDELDDMIAEFRLYNLGNLLGVGQVESHIGKSGIQHTSTDIVHLATHTGRAGIFRIQTSQCREGCLALVDTVGVFAQLVLDTIDFLHRDPWLLGKNLHLYLCWYKRNTVGRKIVEITTNLSWRNLNILHEFLLHFLNQLTVLEVIVHLLTHLGDTLLAVLL